MKRKIFTYLGQTLLFLLLLGSSFAKANGNEGSAAMLFPGACVSTTTVVVGGSMTATTTGQNTAAGYLTRYILVDAANIIVAGPQVSGTFTAPAPGSYRIAAINYSEAVGVTGLQTGQNYNNVIGCFQFSSPKCFFVLPSPVTETCISTTNVTVGGTLSATVSGANTSSGYTTQFLLLNSAGVIVAAPQATGNFTAPTTAGVYRIVVINYSGTVTNLTQGQNISSLSGACFDLSDPKCFNVTPFCAQPYLTVVDRICNASNNTYSVSFSTNGIISRSPSVGTISGNTISGIPLGTNITLTATSACGAGGTSLGVISPTCTNPCTVDLSVGTPIRDCTNNTYSFSVNTTGSFTITGGGTVTGNSVINVPLGTNVTVLATSGSCESNSIVVNSPTGPCPPNCDDPSPRISYALRCNNNGTYDISFIATPNTIVTSSAGGFVNLTGNVTLTVVNTTCNYSGTVNIVAPTCSTTCTDNNPGISYTLECNSDGTYDIIYTLTVGTTVVSSANRFVDLSGNVTLTVTENGCSPRTINVTAPSCTNCEQPTLTVSNIACAANGGWSFTVHTNGTLQFPAGVSLIGNTVNVPGSMPQIGIHSTSSCGEASEVIGITRPTCPVPVECLTPITLSVGTPVTYCSGNLPLYSVSFSSNGTVIANVGTISGNSVIDIPVGTALTLTASNTGCSDQVVTVNSPSNFTCPNNRCTDSNPGISYSLICNSDGTYTINYIANLGTTVVSSAGSFTNLSGNVTLTVTESGCSNSETINIVAPECVTCEQPTLSVGNIVCAASGGWSFAVNTNGTIQVPAGASLSGNIVNVPGTIAQVGLYATNDCGEASETMTISRPTCPPVTCTNPITLSVGTPLTYCTGNVPMYSVSFSSNGTVTATAGTVQGNAIINIPVGTPVILTASSTGCPDQVLTVNSPANFTCPIDLCDDRNPGISYSVLCNSNGTYDINFVTNPGTVVISSTGSFTDLTGNVTLTITETGCNNSKTILIVSPQCVDRGVIALVKTGVYVTSTGNINYTFRVTNVGSETLNNISVNDPMLGGSVALNATTLAAGDSTEGTATYLVTQADRSTGSVTNTATVSGVTPGGMTVEDTSGSTINNDDPTVVPVPSCAPGVRCLTVTATRR